MRSSDTDSVVFVVYLDMASAVATYKIRCHVSFHTREVHGTIASHDRGSTE